MEGKAGNFLMIEFEKYCALYDYIKGKSKLSVGFPCAFMLGSIVTFAPVFPFGGERTIDFMIDQSDLDTLQRIRMDFPDGSRQRDHIDRRIAYIIRHGSVSSVPAPAAPSPAR